MGISEGNVWLDIVDGCLVHKICTFYDENGRLFSFCYNFYESDGREGEPVGTEGRTSGEDSHVGIATKSGRTYGRAEGSVSKPIFAMLHIFTEAPDQPEVREAFNATDCVKVAIPGQEVNL